MNCIRQTAAAAVAAVRVLLRATRKCDAARRERRLRHAMKTSLQSRDFSQCAADGSNPV